MIHAFGVLVATGALAWFARATGAAWRAVVAVLATGAAAATLAFFAPAAYALATVAVVVAAHLATD